MPIKTNLYNISSYNFKKMDDLTKLSSGIWTFPNLSFHNEDILGVSISVLHAEFPNTIYIINESNNKLIINNSITGIQTITFTLGNYNVNQLITMFATLAGPLGYTMTYSNTTNKLTISANNAFSILASSSSTYILGIGANNLSSVSNSITFPFCINLLPTARFNLRSTVFNIGNFGSDNSTDIILTIQNTGSIGCRSLYQNFGNLKFQLNIDNLTSFDLRLTDDYNNLLNFNGAPWYISFQLDIEYLEKPKPPSFEEVLMKAAQK